MVFTHLPANGLLILAAFMPTAPLAIAALLARSALSQMDVPARTSYVMAVVSPPERPAAASVTNVPRSLAPVAVAGARRLDARAVRLRLAARGRRRHQGDLRPAAAAPVSASVHRPRNVAGCDALTASGQVRESLGSLDRPCDWPTSPRCCATSRR